MLDPGGVDQGQFAKRSRGYGGAEVNAAPPLAACKAEMFAVGIRDERAHVRGRNWGAGGIEERLRDDQARD